MSRTSRVHYIAPSAISITPNANSSSRDLAVNVTLGATIKVYSQGIQELGYIDNAIQEWTFAGRNRRLKDSSKPYTIYIRLSKSDRTTGYLCFCEKQTRPEGWQDKWCYVTEKGLSPQYVSGKGGATGIDYLNWWIKVGEVSEPANGLRTVTLDTGILGTDEYNNGWSLNPDDFPANPVRIIKEDRGQWTATPKTVYAGVTGTATPDGTLGSTIAAALGWTGTSPLSFINGQEIDEPYHARGLTRQRWITQRLLDSNNSLTDAELYSRLIADTYGWEEENMLEVSRVWNYGILWECQTEGAVEEPRWNCANWQAIGGQTVYTGEITTPNGRTFRNGNVNTILTMNVWFGTENITERVVLLPDFSTSWSRSTGYDEDNDEFVQQSEDLSWTPTSAGAGKIKLLRGDMGSGWMISYRQALINCLASFSAEGQVINMPADYVF